MDGAPRRPEASRPRKRTSTADDVWASSCTTSRANGAASTNINRASGSASPTPSSAASVHVPPGKRARTEAPFKSKTTVVIDITSSDDDEADKAAPASPTAAAPKASLSAAEVVAAFLASGTANAGGSTKSCTAAGGTCTSALSTSLALQAGEGQALFALFTTLADATTSSATRPRVQWHHIAGQYLGHANPRVREATCTALLRLHETCGATNTLDAALYSHVATSAIVDKDALVRKAGSPSCAFAQTYPSEPSPLDPPSRSTGLVTQSNTLVADAFCRIYAIAKLGVQHCEFAAEAVDFLVAMSNDELDGANYTDIENFSDLFHDPTPVIRHRLYQFSCTVRYDSREALKVVIAKLQQNLNDVPGDVQELMRAFKDEWRSPQDAHMILKLDPRFIRKKFRVDERWLPWSSSTTPRARGRCSCARCPNSCCA
ncbi:hypothetical protein AMAG_17972 [Allomyces macrogynus ATCC 38327]|uniref:Uncharacterized protein n=1 Tax=Allomyces macrogynus (strain ATCC 38327) TaxID=578462 RepID=A0A0L0S2M7_ALLM3|nr:hypothetical protein AMAG_17972 [Allomyces macrogynus ATCC 38327]|eukprot:KNE56793.1 hypothetical protein AMAG_17972 [Allomyces macrogynus ATCC 38327]